MTSKWFISRRCGAAFLALAFSLVFCCFFFLSQTRSTAARNEDIVSFYASFDQNILADRAGGDESPLGNQNLEIVREGRKGSAVYLDAGSLLTYDAPGNLYAERGTIAFWWELDEPVGDTPFSLIRISAAQQRAQDFTFAELDWTGESLRLSVYDRDGQPHQVEADSKHELVSGRWFHLAFSWDELDGIRLYIDGHPIAHQLGELHLSANLDQIGIHASVVTPYQTRGTDRKVFIDELRVYSAALTEAAIEDLAQLGGGRAGAIPSVMETSPEFWSRHWKARFGWDDRDSIPRITSPASIRKISVIEGRDLKKFSVEASDGKPETLWPYMGVGYSDQGKALDLIVEKEPFNYLWVQGNLKGQVYQIKDGQKIMLLDRSHPAGETSVTRLASPVTAQRLRVERQDGVLSELSLFAIGNSPPTQQVGEKSNPPAAFLNPPTNRVSYRLMLSSAALGLQGVSRGQIASLYNLRPRVLGRYLPQDRETWVGVPGELYKPPDKSSSDVGTFRYSHVILPSFLSHTGVDAIKLKLTPGGGKRAEETMLNLAVKDPVVSMRDLINLNLKLPAEGPVEIVLDIPDVVFPAGIPVWLTLASDQKDFGASYLNGAEVEIWMTEAGQSERGERSRREYLSERLRLIRSDFQTLSQSRLWMTTEVAKVRRQFKLVEEFFQCVEDVLRVDPKEPSALAYAGWTKRNDPPPDFKQPELPAPDIPRWAFQQEFLIKQFRQILDWWVKNRQIETGEIGGGLSRDTTLVSNWTGIALMEGPGEHYRESLRSVLDACYRRGMIKNGLNSRRMDALQAYEQGINTIPAALLLDYGNPTLVERLMETAQHYERLTGINSAGHRHFRSTLFSATELIEGGRAAREDVYSQLMWQPGLYLTWYNGNPLTLRWLTEYANALLAHWDKDRYPMLARGIRFGSDEVVSKGLPNAEVVNLMWGVYRLTGDEKYLWLIDTLLKSGNVDRAEVTNGRWLEFVDSGLDHGPILDEVRKRNIWDHNLQTDEAGLLARQLAFELTGDKKQVEDYQAALIKHLAQNMILYTEAEPSTDAVWLPQRATQRARLGGVADFRHCIYPGNAISWEGTAGSVTSLVRKASNVALKVIVFNSAKSLQDVTLRVWELENGTYEVIEGTDVNGDDQIDVVTTNRTLPLKRHTAISLSLRPRRTTIIDIKQIHKGTPIWELSDLAISPEDVQYDTASDKLRMTIHNIGGSKSPPFELTLENEKRTPLFKKELDGLEAPSDLKPKTVTVELSGLRSRGAKSIVIKLDPANHVEEITDENNQLRKSLLTP
jgi:hypothetical protein